MTSKFLLGAAILFFVPTLFAQHLSVSKKDVPFFDFDISGSTGNYNGKTYTEVQLGLNLNFAEWLTWRNAAFQRFSSGTDKNLVGLDSSLRFSQDFPFDTGTLKFFAGPGYRWAERSDRNAFFGEVGTGFHLGRLAAEAGVRFMHYDKTQFDSSGLETKQEDISYFITVAGGAGLSF